MDQKPAAPAGTDKIRDADRAAIEKLRQRDVSATLSRDPIALTELWTDDAIRLGPGHSAQVGQQAIRESNAHWAARPGLKVLTYVPETKGVDSPGAVAGVSAPLAGQPAQGPAAPAGGDRGSDADRAAIEKGKHDDVAATVARDAAAMADLWTEDAVRFGPDGPAHIGRPAIRAANERSTSSPLKVLSFVPETRDLRIWEAVPSSGVPSPLRLSHRPVPSRRTFVARCLWCSRSSRTAAGKSSARWGFQNELLHRCR